MKTRTNNILTSLALGFPLLGIAVLGADGPAALEQTVDDAMAYRTGDGPVAFRQLEQLVARAAGDDTARAETVAALNRLLSPDATYEAKRFACQQLAIVGDASSVEPLAALLRHPETVGIACYALAGNPSSEAGGVLRQAVAMLDGAAKAQAVAALGTRRDGEATALIVGELDNPDPLVGEAAFEALGNIGTRAAYIGIRPFFDTSDPKVARAAAGAALQIAADLARSGDRNRAAVVYRAVMGASRFRDVRRGAFGALLELVPERSDGIAIDTLRGDDEALHPVAIAWAARSPNADSPKRFADVLTELPPAQRVWLLDALADRGATEALPTVEAQLGDPALEVREAAIEATGRLADGSAVPVLARALARAETERERRLVEQAMVGLAGGSDTDRALEAQLRMRTTEPKEYLVAAIARRGGSNSVAVLLREAGSTDPKVATAAFRGLGRLAAPEDLPGMLKRLADLRAEEARATAEEATAQALSGLEPTTLRSANVLGALPQAATLAGRCSLVRLLPVCQDQAALDATLRAAASEDPALRDVAVRALADWPNDAVWGDLTRIYQSTETESHRILVLRGLVRIAGDQNPQADARLVERYRTLFAAAASDQDRRLILGALSGCARLDALELAEAQLDHPAIRAETVAAVRQIAEAIKAQHPDAAKEALERVNQGG